jgi:DNA-binding transcriptional MocR family regulator
VSRGAPAGGAPALAAELRAGDALAVEDPGYYALFDVARALGLSLRPVAIDAEGMLPGDLAAALEEGAAAVVITPRGQNPAGTALSAARAAQLRDVLNEWPGALVIEDDHLGPVAGAARQTLTPGRDRWVALRSVGKSLGPDLRLAVLCGDTRTVTRVEGRQRLGPGWVSLLLQQVAADAWSACLAEGTFERARACYAERREALTTALHEHGIDALGASGFNVWVPVEDELRAVTYLLGAGWAVAAGAPYRLRAAPAIRITTASLRPAEAPALAAEIADALAPAARTRAA